MNVDEIKQRYLHEIINGCSNCKRHNLELVDREVEEKFELFKVEITNYIVVCQNCGHEKRL